MIYANKTTLYRDAPYLNKKYMPIWPLFKIFKQKEFNQNPQTLKIQNCKISKL